MKHSKFECGVDVVLRNRRWGVVAASMLLLALSAPAMNPAQRPGKQATGLPVQPLAGSGNTGRPSEAFASSRIISEKIHLTRVWELPGEYIDEVVIQSYAGLAKSVVGGIDRLTFRLHCERAQFTERLRASGLNLPYTGPAKDDGCAL